MCLSSSNEQAARVCSALFAPFSGLSWTASPRSPFWRWFRLRTCAVSARCFAAYEYAAPLRLTGFVRSPQCAQILSNFTRSGLLVEDFIRGDCKCHRPRHLEMQSNNPKCFHPAARLQDVSFFGVSDHTKSVCDLKKMGAASGRNGELTNLVHRARGG